MATMNKPSAGDTNWYQLVTDNWTSIENDLIDKSTFTAKGDLVSASAALTPVRVGVGANGQVLIADSSQAAGIKWGTAGVADLLLGKTFLSDHSLLPSTTIREDLSTWPAAGFSNLNGGTASLSLSRARFVPSGNPANFGWDLGSSYTKVLMILGMARPSGYNQGIFFSRTSGGPITSEPKDGFMFLVGTSGDTYLYRSTSGGAQTLQQSETKAGGNGTFNAPSFGLGLYYDASADRCLCLLRAGSEIWWPVFDVTDSPFADFRYAGCFFSAPGSSSVMWAGCPLGIYAQ